MTVAHFLVWGFFKFFTTKEPNSENYRHILSRDDCSEKIYIAIISAVGLFCCDKVEETPKEKVVNMLVISLVPDINVDHEC